MDEDQWRQIREKLQLKGNHEERTTNDFHQQNKLAGLVQSLHHNNSPSQQPLTQHHVPLQMGQNGGPYIQYVQMQPHNQFQGGFQGVPLMFPSSGQPMGYPPTFIHAQNHPHHYQPQQQQQSGQGPIMVLQMQQNHQQNYLHHVPSQVGNQSCVFQSPPNMSVQVPMINFNGGGQFMYTNNGVSQSDGGESTKISQSASPPTSPVRGIVLPDQGSKKRKVPDLSDIVPGELPKRRKTKKLTTTSSKYRGVSWHKRDKRWMARIWIKGKIRCLGNYVNERKAALAVDGLLSAAYGPNEVVLNFPDPEERRKVEEEQDEILEN